LRACRTSWSYLISQEHLKSVMSIILPCDMYHYPPRA
jgi:hypothetical protein